MSTLYEVCERGSNLHEPRTAVCQEEYEVDFLYFFTKLFFHSSVKIHPHTRQGPVKNSGDKWNNFLTHLQNVY